MTVSPDDIKTLHAKIDDRHQIILDKIDKKVTEPIGALVLKIGVMLEKYDNQEKTNIRLSKDIEVLDGKYFEMYGDVVELKANQKNSKSFWDKFGAPLIYAVIIALSALNYWK